MRLMIADDEQMTRESLRKIIDWRSLGVDEVLLASDGIDALEISSRTPPDVLLTDVRMPIMDGIELAQCFAIQYPHCKVLFLSGYSEKEYLVSAIKLKANAYIEKPIDPDEVAANVLNAVKEVQANQSRLQQDLERMDLLCTSFLWSILTKDIYQARNDLEKMLVDHASVDWTASSAYIENVAEKERLYTLLRPQNMKGRIYTCVSEGFVHVLTTGSNSLSTELLVSCAQELEIHICIGSAGGMGGVEEASQIVNNAIKAARNAFYFGHELIKFEELSQEQSDMPIIISEPLTNPIETEMAIKQICDNFRETKHLSVSTIRGSLFRIANLLVKDAQFHRISPNPLSLDPSELWSWVNQHPTLDDAEKALLEVLNSLSVFDKSRYHIREALRYIDDNLEDYNLSLGGIANYLNMNYSYLSTLFKEETNQTVVNYIRQRRMERAKSLLTNCNIKTQDVAQMVGYADASWFTKKFKQAFGVTPCEYRERCCR